MSRLTSNRSGVTYVLNSDTLAPTIQLVNTYPLPDLPAFEKWERWLDGISGCGRLRPAGSCFRDWPDPDRAAVRGDAKQERDPHSVAAQTQMYPRLARPATDHVAWKTRYAFAGRPRVAQLTECVTDSSDNRSPRSCGS
jgi:hypothetical protein